MTASRERLPGLAGGMRLSVLFSSDSEGRTWTSSAISTFSHPHMTKPADPRRRPYLPRRVAPPLSRELGGPQLAGLNILEEHPGIGGFVLWVSFRDADLWIAAEDRSSILRSEGREGRREEVAQLKEPAYSEIKPALLMLADLPIDHGLDSAEVGSGCDCIAGWSEARGNLGTAVEFAQVASFAVPDRALFAVRVGRVLRMRAEYARSITWFDYGITLARARGDWEAYAQGNAGLGCLHMQRGNYPRARRILRRSLRIAIRHHLPERAGAAYHNLFAVEASTGNWLLAEDYATKALAHYPLGARGLPRLARDLAFRWIERGHFARALPLSQEVLQHFTVAADRALVLSDIARAAAGASAHVEIIEDAWAQAYALLKTNNVDPFEVDILLNLAQAASMREDVVRAEMVVRRALDVAQSRRQGEAILAAEALLHSLRSPTAPTARADEWNEVADTFVRVLQQARTAAA